VKKEKGLVFVISGPSGCGKTTLCRMLLKENLGLLSSTSLTTRAPRRGERREIDYIYVAEDEFKKGLKDKKFLEYAKVFGKYYGTPKKPVIDAIKKGKDIILSIDAQGAAQIKRAIKEAVLIFILPPSFDDLKKRLLKRSSETASQIKRRLRVAHNELRAMDMYDYAVINDDMKEALNYLSAIILAERCRIKGKG